MTTLTQFSEAWQTHWPASALGWTLLHFCWQGAVVALALWCALGLLPARWTRARYAAACAALLLMAALPLATFTHLALEARRTAPELPALRMDAFFTPDVAATPHTQPWREPAAQALDEAAPLLPAVWLAGVVLFLARLNLGLLAARKMKITGTEAAPEPLQRLLAQLSDRLGVERAVRLMHSALIQVPTVVGWLRPMILLPIGCFTGLSEDQIEALLAHELAHIRRHDYLVSVFQSVVEALLFYHPAVWWVSRQVRQERECCCDELAIGISGDRLAYARALSFLEQRRAASPQMALGANGGVLTMRIRRLLGLKPDTVASQAAALALLGVVVAVGCSYLVTIARAQPKATQSNATQPAPQMESIQAAPATGLAAVAAAAPAKPQLTYQQQKSSRIIELDHKVQAAQDTLAFLEHELQIVKQDDHELPPDTRRSEEQLLQSKVDQARQMFQQDYRQLVAAATAEPKPGQAGAVNSGEDFGTARGIYKSWVDEDVRWIITDAERQAFVVLANDEERDMFITQFWARRNPPGAAPDTSKEQHYARIAYSNIHFGTANLPGWRSDRGHVYIVYGKPDSIDSHPSGSQVSASSGQGGSFKSPYPFEVWHYNSIPGFGENVDFDFVDTCRCGEFHYTIDRADKAGQPANGDPLGRAAKVLSPPRAAQPIAYKPDSAPQIAPKPTLHGVIRFMMDKSGNRIRDAVLTATNLDTGKQITWTTDQDGTYTFDNLPDGSYSLTIETNGSLLSRQENLHIVAGLIVGSDNGFKRRLVQVLSGKLVDEAGNPVRGATLIATNTDDGSQLKRFSDDAGAYSFRYLSAGNYNLEVQADGFQRLLQENVKVDPSKSVGLNLRLSRSQSGQRGVASSPTGISGRVVDAAGNGIRGATLTAIYTESGGFVRQVSYGSGEYSFTNLPYGNCNIEVAADGFLRLLQENVHIEAGKTTALNFRLQPGGTGKTPPIAAQPGMVQWLMPGITAALDNSAR